MRTQPSSPIVWMAVAIAVLALVPIVAMTAAVAAVAWMPIVVIVAILAIALLVQSLRTRL